MDTIDKTVDEVENRIDSIVNEELPLIHSKTNCYKIKKSSSDEPCKIGETPCVPWRRNLFILKSIIVMIVEEIELPVIP